MMLRFPSVICTLYTVFFSYYRIPSKTLFTEKVSHEGNDADLRRGCLLSGSDFNPRSHEGNDEEKTSNHPKKYQFQSTFPRGERHFFNDLINNRRNFNPRSHEGNDGWIPVGEIAGSISIHVPTRGTTERRKSIRRKRKISIHVPTRGTTKSRYRKRSM